MKGSLVGGQVTNAIARLNQSNDLKTFHEELLRVVGSEIVQAQSLLGFVDPESKALSLPSWLTTYLDQHSDLRQKLSLGQPVRIVTEDAALVRPANSANVWLIPLVFRSTLQGIIALVSPLQSGEFTTAQIERVQQLAFEVAPIVSRLREVESLRRDTQSLWAYSDRALEQQKQLVQALEQNTHLKATIEMRSRLQANLAHDLRTPMAAIRGYARMLLDGKGGQINDTQRKFLSVVSDNTTRLINLVSWMSHIADFSATNFDVIPFDLKEAWAECAIATKTALAAKDLSLNEQVPDENFIIVGDREKLVRVLKELLGAAVHFSHEGGKITAQFSHGREMEVTVKLSSREGAISSAVLDRICDRSPDATQPRSESMSGDGYSLSYVYDVVGMHGGRVYVNSSDVQGITLLFTLPSVTLSSEENRHEQAVNSGSRRR